jgi:hypothetical protein
VIDGVSLMCWGLVDAVVRLQFAVIDEFGDLEGDR